MVAFGIWLCFPGGARVTTPTGPKEMKDLNIGETVRVVTPEGRVEWSQTCGWLHKMPKEIAEYVCLTTSHRRLVVSESHLVAVVKSGVIEFVPAADIKQGMTLLECDTNLAQPTATPVWGNAVQSVGRVQAEGVYAPLTVAGTIVVDGVAASCYAATKSHRAAHVAMKPMRSMWRHNPERMKAEPHVGTHIVGAHRYIDFLGHVKMATSRKA